MGTQDGHRVAWISAGRPNYKINVDLKYPYSELPFLGQFRLKKLPYDNKILEHVDYWGQGRIKIIDYISGFPDVYNINDQIQLVSDGPDFHTKITNRIPVSSDNDCDTSAYIKDNSVRTVTLKAPVINKSCAIDIARMINNDVGRIVLYGFRSNSDSFDNVKELVKQKNIFFCPYYELPPELKTITASDSYSAFLNFSDMKKNIYQNITNGKYDEAVEQTRWMDKSVLQDFANGLLIEKIPNVMSFAYRLWENRKEIIRNYFPKSFELVLSQKFVIIVNQEYHQNITLNKHPDQNRRFAWGTYEKTSHDSNWHMFTAWENNAVTFEICNPLSDWYLGLDVNVDQYGDRLAYATASHNEDRYKFYLELLLNDDGDAAFFIINFKYGQGLKLDVNTDGEGYRPVWGNKDDVHETEVLEKSKRFRWVFKNW